MRGAVAVGVPLGGEGVGDGVSLVDALTLAAALCEGEPLPLPAADCDCEPETEGETLPLPLTVAGRLADGERLAEMLGVPSHTQTPSLGAPQERRQHSAGQDVVDGVRLTLDVGVGGVCEGVGVTQVQTTSG